MSESDSHRTKDREVDSRGNCSKCGGTHHGSYMCPMSQSPQGECPNGDYEQAKAIEPQGSRSESPAHLTSKTSAEVDFVCGHTVSHEEACPRCEVERLRAALRQWRRAYLDHIDNYGALNLATNLTNEILGDRHPQDCDANENLPADETPATPETRPCNCAPDYCMAAGMLRGMMSPYVYVRCKRPTEKASEPELHERIDALMYAQRSTAKGAELDQLVDEQVRAETSHTSDCGVWFDYPNRCTCGLAEKAGESL